MFLNKYKCYKCNHSWSETYECSCDSECPQCDAKNNTCIDSVEALSNEENEVIETLKIFLTQKIIEYRRFNNTPGVLTNTDMVDNIVTTAFDVKVLI